MASLPVPPLTLDELNEAATFVGDLMQTPPMVSAVKNEGRAALQTRPQRHRPAPRASPGSPRPVPPRGRRPRPLFPRPSPKATYVRSVAHDLGQKLGCGAHLAQLRRVVSGKFDVADALPLAAALQLSERELEKRVLPFLKLASG